MSERRDWAKRVGVLVTRREDVWSVARFTRGVLRPQVNAMVARDSVMARMVRRNELFLDMVEHAVFAQPASPYRALFGAAGYSLDRVRSLVGDRGLDTALEVLAAAGVFVRIDEFKGRRRIERNGLSLTVSDGDFVNPLVRRGLIASSGGSRSRGVLTRISDANLRLGADHLALALNAYGLTNSSAAVWLPFAHGASLWAVLAFAIAGQTPQEWFAQFSTDVDPSGVWFARYWGLHLGSRFAGVKLPRARHVPAGGEGELLERLSTTAGPWVVFTTPSFAIRLAFAARHAGRDLKHVTFLVIGEPLTRAKMAAIDSVGARAYASLGFTEFGRATYGCARPLSLDDGHVCLDAIAVAQHQRVVDSAGTSLKALLFTALPREARKIFINMETGDYANLERRACGCPLESLGWTLHMQEIRSFEKLNAEGQLFFGSQLITLVEEILPSRFGGTATDFQLVEYEDATGFTRMSVRVHPRLGTIDENDVLECVRQSLATDNAMPTRVWEANGTLAVERAEPIVTRAGKSLALHHLV